MLPTPDQITTLRKEFETELFDHVLPFWERHSMDTQYGGFFDCLGRDGSVYDTTKYTWLMARQVWMFSKLYNEVEHRSNWLEMAGNGLEFLRKYARDKDNRVCFSLTREGKPLYRQRKIFSECFYTIALAQYARATGGAGLEGEVKSMLESLWELAFTPGKAGRPLMPGDDMAQTLAVPMILLNVLEEMPDSVRASMSQEVSDCIAAILRHHINGNLYENITKSGDRKSTATARLLNPGHAIEAGWFLQHWARTLGDGELLETSIDIIRRAFDRGWDREFGGLYYFLDAEGMTPIQLEWNMKLWWPHCEAMYAHLLNYTQTRDERDWDDFIRVKEYAFTHFSDPGYGEWFGYLDREGKVTHEFKGGPYKGCFHVPRSLYYCWKRLNELEKGAANA